MASHFDSDGMLRCRGRRLDTPRLPAPLPAVWWAAGFSFSRGSLLREVPYLSTVPGLFFGEEPVMLLRMWLAGWDVFCPTHTVVFHQWSRAHRPTPCSVRVHVIVWGVWRSRLCVVVGYGAVLALDAVIVCKIHHTSTSIRMVGFLRTWSTPTFNRTALSTLLSVPRRKRMYAHCWLVESSPTTSPSCQHAR